jgi:hypothetical protein
MTKSGYLDMEKFGLFIVDKFKEAPFFKRFGVNILKRFLDKAKP